MTLDPDPWTTEGRTLRLLAELAEEWEIEHIESSTFPVGKLKVVDDFLPLPDQLILKKEIKND
jgi:hypothetical protein